MEDLLIYVFSATALAILVAIGFRAFARYPAGPPTEIVVANYEALTLTRYSLPASSLNVSVSDRAPSVELSLPFQPTAVTFDVSGNLYVAGGQKIYVYPPGANSQTQPSREISGYRTELQQSPSGLAVDAAGTLYVANPGAGYGSVLIFSPQANGDSRPDGKILSRGDGASHTGLELPSGVAVDTSGQLHVADSAAGQVLVFAQQAGGGDLDISPIMTIADLPGVQQVALGADGTIYVTTRDPDSIRVYDPVASSNPSPIRSISSPQVDNPFGIAVDSSGKTYVPNIGDDSVVVFAADAAGTAVVPSWKLKGPATKMNGPYAISVAPVT